MFPGDVIVLEGHCPMYLQPRLWRDDKSRILQYSLHRPDHHMNGERVWLPTRLPGTCSILKPEEGECSSFLLVSNKMVVE